MPVNKVRQFINAIDNDETGLSAPPFVSNKLRGLVELVSKPVGLKQQLEVVKNEIKNELAKQQPIDIKDEIKNELEAIKDELQQQMKNEFKQQMRDELNQTKDELMKGMQELLCSFIKN